MLNPLNALRRFWTRNFAVSNMWLIKTKQPVYPDWTVELAVKKGYVASGWVYRAVYLLQAAASQPPWVVYNAEGEMEEDHAITTMLKQPHPYIPSQEVWKLITSWMFLSGNGYFKKVKAGGRTEELWPVSPDRLAPVPAGTLDEWIQGYALDRKARVEFTPEEIIHLKFVNPSNPLIGISPLQAASRAVGIDTDQQDWNKALGQNRGVVDGVFSFDEPFDSQDKADAISAKLNERYRGKRRFAVLGGGAKYHRTGMTAVEMDYMNSRKFNREEIFIIFGVPPQYAGVMEKSTYNNYQTSEMVFWFGTVIPYLMDIGNQLTFNLSEELNDGEKILPDLSEIPAVRKALEDKSKTAKIFHQMGVPFAQINKQFNFGFQEYPGWEDSLPQTKQIAATGSEGGDEGRAIASGASSPLITLHNPVLMVGEEKRGEVIQLRGLPRLTNTARKTFTLVETRSDPDAIAEQREAVTVEEVAPMFFDILQRQQEDILAHLQEDNTGSKVKEILGRYDDDLISVLTEVYQKYSVMFGLDVVVERADLSQELGGAVEAVLDDEMTILTEKSLINKTSASLVTDQVKWALQEGAAFNELQQAIEDVGAFSSARAARIGRTTVGSASSIGQFTAAKMSGARFKIWRTSKFEVRPGHVKREGEKVRINQRFSEQYGSPGPRYPLDPQIKPADRVNCRCSMSFSID